MKNALRDELLVVLLALLGLTVASWTLQLAPWFEPRHIGLAVLAIAFLKARLIVVHYMETKRATWPIRIVFEAWVVGTAAMVLSLY